MPLRFLEELQPESKSNPYRYISLLRTEVFVSKRKRKNALDVQFMYPAIYVSKWTKKESGGVAKTVSP